MRSIDLLAFIEDRIRFHKSLPPCEMTIAVIGELNYLHEVLKRDQS